MPKIEQYPLDSRIRDINLKRGKITGGDIAKHLKSLPDDSGHAEELIIQEEDSESAAPEERVLEDSDFAHAEPDEAESSNT